MAYDDIINNLNDQDWGWWPFLRHRPSKHQRVSLGRLSLMSLLCGSVYGAGTIVVFASLGQAPWGHFPGVLIFFVLLFFVGWGAMFRPSWNRRAGRLAAEARASRERVERRHRAAARSRRVGQPARVGNGPLQPFVSSAT